MSMTSIDTSSSDTDKAPERKRLTRRLDYLPVSLFGSVMGLTGLSVAWRVAQGRYGAPHEISDVFGALAVATFIALALAYGVKLVTAADAVKAEFHHPIAGNLFGTILISMLLLPIVLAPVALVVARVLWIVGAVGMFVFAWMIVSRWMSDRQQIAHATPAWVIPVVGLLDVPPALPSLGLPPLHGVMVASLAIGLFFAVPLFTLILSRLVFEPPMPDALKPTLLILVAPFAVGFSTYTVTIGSVDLFAQSLYALTLFVLAVLLGRLRTLILTCPFHVSWWAVSFPFAASAITAERFAVANTGLGTDAVALALLAAATVIIAGLAVRTLVGIARGRPPEAQQLDRCLSRRFLVRVGPGLPARGASSKTALFPSSSPSMDTRISRRFAALKAEGRAGLVTFTMSGDPDGPVSLEVLKALPAAGADIIEFGMPFTDPMADGPAIQAAGLRALKAGMTLAQTLELVAAFRRENADTPIILMGYYNPIYIHGVERFLEQARTAGVDGLIVVDLPPEEDAELCLPARAAGLDFIRLATPTTDAVRLPTVLQNTSGFLYYVSIAGITGTATPSYDSVASAVARFRAETDLPIAVGFGVNTAENAAAIAGSADAVVVGSAIIKALQGSLDGEGRATAGTVSAVTALVSDLARGVRSAVRAETV